METTNNIKSTKANLPYLNSSAELVGKIITVPKLSHTFRGENFYEFALEVERLSGKVDRVPVMISDRLLTLTNDEENALYVNKNIALEGQIRTYRIPNSENVRKHVKVLFFAKSYHWLTDEDITDIMYEGKNNKVEIEGYLSRVPFYRKTPLGKEISDVFIAVNRPYGRTDYIPCIAWGRNAKYAESLKEGTFVTVTGRFQSREYEKRVSEDDFEWKTAYEVSLFTIQVDEEKSKYPKEREVDNERAA